MTAVKRPTLDDMALLRGEPYLVISGDSHAGPNPDQHLRPYCPDKYLPQFDAFCADARQQKQELLATVSAGRAGEKADPTLRERAFEAVARNLEADSHWDPAARLRDMDDSGVAAEVIFSGG